MNDRQWLLWMPVYGCGALLGIWQASPCNDGPSLCMQGWLEFWLRDYSDGFQRRGLMGTIVRLLSPNHLDIVVANGVALIFFLVIAMTTAVLVYRMSEDFWSRAAGVVLMASPLMAVFFEVLGELLQAVFVLFLVCAGLMARYSNSTLRWLCAAAFSVAGVLIHEAALLLFVPAMLLVVVPTRRPGTRHYAAFAGVGAVLLCAILLLEGGPKPGEIEYHAVNPISGATILPRVENIVPPLSVLFQEEIRKNFGSPQAVLWFVLRFPKVWSIPFLALVLMLGIALSRNEGPVLLRFWLFLTVCSVPLYLIAHDWGRFAAITFWLALIVTVLVRRQGLSAGASPGQDSDPWRIGQTVMPEKGLVFGVVSSLILSASVNTSYRDSGIPGHHLLILPVALIAWTVWRTRRAAESSPSNEM